MFHTIKKTSPYFFVLFALLLGFASCGEEVGPDIERPTVGTKEPVDISGTPVRRIIIEEFTGAGCVNCPQGAQIIQNLVNTHGTRLIPIAIHTGFFANPLSTSMYDFRIPEGAELDALIGPVQAYPSASINRKLFPSENSRILTSGTWAGYVSAELEIAPVVGIDIINTYDSNTRELDITVSSTFTETVTNDLALSVVLTENNIVDAQLDNTGLIPMYTHKHVLRKMLTSANGAPMVGVASGETIVQTFGYTLPADWVDSNCHVVAFVHQSPPDLEILQAAEASLIE